MPNGIPTVARVKKTDGTLTGRMSQQTTETYLGNLIKANRQANLKQALNDVFGGKGKPTGDYKEDGQAVWHASAGKAQTTSVTLFFSMSGDEAIVFAMGEHTGSTSYRVTDYGQPNGSFTQNATITL